MTAAFIKILNMSAAASLLALAVILLRLVFRKAPRSVSVLMWGLVGIRLICPFSVESTLSLVPRAKTFPRYIAYSASNAVPVGSETLGTAGGAAESGGYLSTLTGVSTAQTAVIIASAVWMIGIAVMLIYAIFSYLRIHARVRESVPYADGIYMCDRIRTPFILGILRPRIYLPTDICSKDIGLVTAHERAHLKRCDHLWKPLGFLLLTLYWFNPVMWVSYILFCGDIELACDERVIETLGEGVKKPYSEALINCSDPRSTVSSCPLAFGETGVKTRIKAVLGYKRPATLITALAVIAAAAVAVCFLTDPASVRLANIEGYSLEHMADDTVTAWSSDGEDGYSSLGAVEKELLLELCEIKISEREDRNLSKGGDVAHTLVLQSDEDTHDVLSSYLRGVYVHFDADFTIVWVDMGEMCTHGHRIEKPEEARRIWEAVTQSGD